MNRDEARRLLHLRMQYTETRYNDDTIDAWASALSDVHYGVAQRALMTLARGGQKRISIAELGEYLPKPAPAEPGPPDLRRLPDGSEHHHRCGCRDCRAFDAL